MIDKKSELKKIRKEREESLRRMKEIEKRLRK